MAQRLPPEQRRIQYLDAAVELLSERFRSATADSAYALAHVRLVDVAARAGVSKGALYHIWPQQEAYWADLLKAIFADMTPFGGSYGAWLKAVGTDEDADVPKIGELFDAILESRSTNSSVLTLMTLAAYRHDPAIYEAVTDQIRMLGPVYEPLVGSLLEQSGRTIRSDVDPLTLVMVFRAIQDGLVFRHTYSPERFPDLTIDGRDTTLFSLMLEALLIWYSEPLKVDALDTGTATTAGPVPPTDLELGELLSLPLPTDTIRQLRVIRRENTSEELEPSDDVASRYIDVGLDLLDEFTHRHPNPLTLDGLSNLRISDVADAVGVSKGSLYHIWSSQDAFRVDVLNHVLSTSNDSSTKAVHDTPMPGDPEERVRTVSDLAFDFLKNDMRFYARFGFTFMASHPDVTNVLTTAEIEIREIYVRMLFDALEARGRQLRAPIDQQLFLLCVEAALYGCCLVYRSSPILFDGYREGSTADMALPPSRFAEIIEAIWFHFSEPIPD